jgi:hypothetical protein
MNPTALDRAYEAMGKYNEKMYMPIIKRIYGNLLKTSFKFATIDFYGVDYMLELKSRDCFSYDYKDTMFGYNKVVDAIETLDHYKDHMPHYKVYFAFAFKDGLFIWEYNSKTYEDNGGDSQKRIGGTKNRGKDDFKEHYYVKIENLTKVDDTPVWIHPAVKENTEKRLEEKKNKNKSSIPDGVCFLKLIKKTT